MGNRSGLVGFARVSLASGRDDREMALTMLSELGGYRRRTIAAGKTYDTADFVTACRSLSATAHIVANFSRL